MTLAVGRPVAVADCRGKTEKYGGAASLGGVPESKFLFVLYVLSADVRFIDVSRPTAILIVNAVAETLFD